MNLVKSLAMASVLALSPHALQLSAAEIDFSDRPDYIPNNVVVLTFDDGPDWNNTAKVLDVLRDKKASATFFINGENWSNINTEEPMRELVRRMVREGHILANHTVHHDHLPELSNADVEQEISGVEQSVKSIFGNGAPALTLLRAPHGEPYQGNDPNFPSADYQRIAPIVARHAVHIGWSIDSFDYNCAPGDSDCVYNNVTSLLQTPGRGSYGVILMHSVHAQTAGALPRLIDYIRNSGFQIWSVEDVVRARYGKNSAQLLGVSTNPSPVGLEANAEYSVVARHSGKCLDIAEHSVIDGGALQQWGCANSGNQRFRLIDAGQGNYSLVGMESGKCLDVSGSSSADGATVHQWGCHGGANQRLAVTASASGSYTLRFAHSGKCLDVSGPSADNGAKVHQWSCHGGSNQDWLFMKR